MKPYFAYIRVSTAKQGERGVSLQEQRDAITRSAERSGLRIVEWFEERETAAKRGRPVFSRMLQLLRSGKATGIIIHKIDRSARNLRDWADLGELIDQGVEVRFATEDLDLHSRGGRLSADIQAVVAADYIRNLREESRKGFYGRIKQGVWPLPAPLGYLDCGAGKPKAIDPAKGPLVRLAFDLYGSGRYNLHTLCEELTHRGLRNRRGKPLGVNRLSDLLNNAFYIGLLKIKRTGETFPGGHEPLISTDLFERVKRILKGKLNTHAIRHDFAFRRLLACKTCGYSLIGERQKGIVYYRCHTKTCARTTIREDFVEEEFERALLPLEFLPEEQVILGDKLIKIRGEWIQQHERMLQTTRLNLDQVEARLTRLTDAFLDGNIEKPFFEERKAKLLLERAEAREKLAELRNTPTKGAERLSEFLELARTAYIQFKLRNGEEKRELVRMVTSNRSADGKKLDFRLSRGFVLVANRFQSTNSGPYRDIPRSRGNVPLTEEDLSEIWDRLLPKLLDEYLSYVT